MVVRNVRQLWKLERATLGVVIVIARSNDGRGLPNARKHAQWMEFILDRKKGSKVSGSPLVERENAGKQAIGGVTKKGHATY